MLVLAAVLISVLITGVVVVFGLQLFGGTSVSEARKEAETIKREAKIEAREDAVRVRAEIEREVAEQRARITKIEERVLAREDEVELRQKELTRREQGIADREVHVKELQDDLKEAKQRELAELERVAGMTVNEAKARLLEQSEELVRHDLARRVRQLDEEAQSEAKRRARNLVADALQRVAASHAAETTSSLIELPSDDMKGRIIGREGRNIRTLEHLTGVDVIVDDTPQAVVLSSFDPIRREIAKITLLKLVEDGRIQPARIEEMYYQSKAEIEEHIVQAGEQAVFEANCGEFHEEIVKLLGRLNYRTSYGQNVLKHTLEVVHLAGLMATELDANVKTTKRAAILHDVGQGGHARDRGLARADLDAVREALRRVAGRHPRRRGAPLRGAAADGRGGAADRGGRDLGRATRSARGQPGELHQAARGARGPRHEAERRREGLRAPGRARDPGHRQAGRDRRRPGRAPVARDRPRDRARA